MARWWWRTWLGRLAVVAVLAGGLGAVSAVSAQAAVYPGIIDLGANVNPTGRPAVVGGHYEVPVSSGSSYGLWVDGTVEAMPAAPATDPGARFEPDAINANGVLVGTTSTSRPAYGTRCTPVSLSRFR